jgi:hypothetical protein
MLAAQFFVWWYGRGWALVFKNMQRRLGQIGELFSVTQLLRTLFAPWRRTITYPGAGLDAHLQALADNSISRLVGFTVRIFVLFTAAITVVLLATVALVEIIAWPLVPVAIVAGIVKGLLP